MDLSDLYEMLVLVWKMMIQMIQNLEVPFETTRLQTSNAAIAEQ